MKKIGSLKIKNPYFLAPMAGINDIAFRILCKKAGAGLVFTGMINPLTKDRLILYDNPAIQIFANSEKGIAEFIKKHEKKAALFDFNLGCPAEMAKKQGIGSFMHRDLKKIEIILRTMRKSTKKPITVKLRKSKEALEIVRIAEKYCDAITIHPRTAEQGYSGIPDMEFAKAIKKMASLPIIYSGNVNEKNAEDILKTFDFIMIGREAMGNPGIFAKLSGSKKRYGFFDYLKLARKHKLKFEHIRSQALLFTRGLKNAKRMREAISRSKSMDEIISILRQASSEIF